MAELTPGRAHLVTGGFPPGSMGGHDHDYARLRLLTLLAERGVPASVGNDFADIGKWLPTCQLLITYVAGPYPDAAQTETIHAWLEAGGHWLGLHGTSGGRAQRVEGARMRRTVKTEHHALLGSMFLTHPPIREFRVEVSKTPSPLTQGLPASFTVEDEPYFIELQDPAATQILLTAEFGPSAAGATEGLYPSDTSLLADGRSRVLGYSREVGKGAVAYFAFGHCHNPAIRAARASADPADTTPPTFRVPWETDAVVTLLRNAIAWGVAA
ncbi:MAG TPA: ThuA domain-containing protein [Stellaceae bacterium]|jgi:type 1 glutamine amidotransferase|nr:ThuA domain-containing protein [Stellaceae bacterium]